LPALPAPLLDNRLPATIAERLCAVSGAHVRIRKQTAVACPSIQTPAFGVAHHHYEGQTMKRKTLALAVIAVGLIVAATSAAFNLYPEQWFGKETVASNVVGLVAQPASAPSPPAASPVPGGTAPNFRAIVQQAGPAVVGVTVEGKHKIGPDEFSLDLNDPFFQFFRG
jgi:hypothetical protein